MEQAPGAPTPRRPYTARLHHVVAAGARPILDAQDSLFDCLAAYR